MPDKDIGRTIRFAESLWNALDRESVRCRRSSQKQLEAILLTYFGLEDVEIDRDRLAETQSRLAPVVAHIGPSDEALERDEITRRLHEGIPLAPTSQHPIPAKLDKTHTQAKRRSRK